MSESVAFNFVNLQKYVFSRIALNFYLPIPKQQFFCMSDADKMT